MYGLNTYLYALTGGFICSFVVNMLLSSRWLRHIGNDMPGERSLHQHPTPRLGGLGILAGALLSQIFGAAWPWEWNLAVILLAAVSLTDDILSLSPLLRLLVQAAGAGIIVSQLQHSAPPLLVAALFLATIWSINLYNFMDGANGLAGGMGLIGFGFLASLAYPVSPLLAGAGAAIAAACAGFLCFNFGQARIFMGDAGSTFLGLMLAVIGIGGYLEQVWPLWLPVMVFSPFIVDASVTLAIRIGSKQRFWLPHREHFYQKLVQMGWSHTQLALASYGLMLACGLLAANIRQKEYFIVISCWLALSAIYAIIAVTIQRHWNSFVAQHQIQVQ